MTLWAGHTVVRGHVFLVKSELTGQPTQMKLDSSTFPFSANIKRCRAQKLVLTVIASRLLFVMWYSRRRRRGPIDAGRPIVLRALHNDGNCLQCSSPDYCWHCIHTKFPNAGRTLAQLTFETSAGSLRNNGALFLALNSSSRGTFLPLNQ